MTEARWIRVSVEVFGHDILDKGPFDRRSAWLWLIAHAAWRDKRINHKGKPLLLKRGEVVAGREFLAETWGWSVQNVRTFLRLLQDEHMIEINQSNGHFANVISITNYDTYQNVVALNDQKANQSLTSVQPVPNQTLTRDTNNTSNTNNSKPASVEQDAARDGLAGSADQMIKHLVGWMPQGTEANARQWLAGTCAAYGDEITRSAYAKLISDLATGRVIAQPIQAWCHIAQRMRESSRTAKPNAERQNETLSQRVARLSAASKSKEECNGKSGTIHRTADGSLLEASR